MSTPPRITSPYAPDLEAVGTWLRKMIAELRFVEIVIAILSLLGRMRDANTELLTKLTHLKRKRPPSETLDRLERQLALPLVDAAVSAAITGQAPPEGDGGAHFGHRDHTNRRIAITRFAASRSERSDVLLGVSGLGSSLGAGA